jgi:hypothetical protein
LVPDYLHRYEDVFAKKSFNTLPEWCQWDHFIKEHLQTGHIHLSKSLMASLCFFIKKNGSLLLIWDYWTLNSITIKNIPTTSDLEAGRQTA